MDEFNLAEGNSTSGNKQLNKMALPLKAIRSVQNTLQAIETHKTLEQRDPSWQKDDDLLMSMGYKPEMRREFNTLELFGVAFSIMSLVPSIASVLTDGLTAGGIGMTWAWLIASAFIMSVALSMSEMSSSQPTSGGLYYWTWMLAPTKIRRPLSFLTGWTNSLGLVSGICSINYGFAGLILSLPTISSNGKYTPTKYEEYGVFVAVTVVHLACLYVPTYFISKFQTVCVILNLVLVFLVLIAIPIGAHNHGILNTGEYIFTDATNQTDWEYGWSFLLSMIACIWTIGAFDSAVHTSEEATNAQESAPKAICFSVILCGILGWAVMAAVASAMPHNYSSIINSWTGQPMAGLIFLALGKKWTMGIMSLMVVAQFGMGLSILFAASRQVFAFARDDALPFSNIAKIVIKSTGVPFFAGCYAVIISWALTCLVLINGTAALALFSLGASSNGLAWLIPIACKLYGEFAEPGKWVPGPFYMGRALSIINNFISVIWLTFVVFVLAMIPTTKHPDATTMNYTVVITVFFWTLSLIALYTIQRNFNGPVLNLDVIESSEGSNEGSKQESPADPQSYKGAYETKVKEV